jgi:hypothetical protein
LDGITCFLVLAFRTRHHVNTRILGVKNLGDLFANSRVGASDDNDLANCQISWPRYRVARVRECTNLALEIW